MEINKITKDTLKHFVVDVPIVTAATLSTLDPTYAAIWVGTTTLLNQMTVDERETFANELVRKEIKQELLGSIEFARATKVTVEAAANTASKEKLEILARLLRNGTNEELIRDFDEYKEFAKLVNEISPREFFILNYMDHFMESGGMFGKIPPPYTLADEEKNRGFRKAADNHEITLAMVGNTPGETRTTLEDEWKTTEHEVKQELNISSDTLQGIVNRLVRTGCVVPVDIHARNKDITVFRLTPLYFLLKEYIKQEVPSYSFREDSFPPLDIFDPES